MRADYYCEVGAYCDFCLRAIDDDGHSCGPHCAARTAELKEALRVCRMALETGELDTIARARFYIQEALRAES